MEDERKRDAQIQKIMAIQKAEEDRRVREAYARVKRSEGVELDPSWIRTGCLGGGISDIIRSWNELRKPLPHNVKLEEVKPVDYSRYLKPVIMPPVNHYSPEYLGAEFTHQKWEEEMKALGETDMDAFIEKKQREMMM